MSRLEKDKTHLIFYIFRTAKAETQELALQSGSHSSFNYPASLLLAFIETAREVLSPPVGTIECDTLEKAVRETERISLIIFPLLPVSCQHDWKTQREKRKPQIQSYTIQSSLLLLPHWLISVPMHTDPTSSWPPLIPLAISLLVLRFTLFPLVPPFGAAVSDFRTLCS